MDKASGECSITVVQQTEESKNPEFRFHPHAPFLTLGVDGGEGGHQGTQSAFPVNTISFNPSNGEGDRVINSGCCHSQM